MNHILTKTYRLLIRAAALTATVVFAIGSGISVQAAPAGKEKPFTVVLDAGHGGNDHGAIDNGAREKDINLGVAKKLAAMLKKKMKDVNVVMTRDDDTFISLQERANIANRNKGDLFVSIHTNSADKSNPNRTKAAGTSVYALGPQKDANNLAVAQRENSVIELEDNYHQKYSGFDPSRDESYIIFEMAQKKNLGQSLRFADKAQKELVKTAGRGDRGVKQAGFWVLWATSMPAVLVELDFICNPTEAEFLTSEKGQEKLATALFNAIKQYAEGSGKNTSAIQKTESTESTSVALTDTSLSQTAADAATSDYASGGTLASRNTRAEKRAPHVASAAPKNSAAPRKRRSAASKQISDARNVETNSIVLKDETAYLVRDEEVKEEEPVQTVIADNSTAKSKNKKQKKKEKKEEKKKEEKSSTKESKGSNKKTFKVVTTAHTEDKATDIEENLSAGATGAPVYKILLLSSDRELSSSDPKFAGFKPTGMYMENNLYKYTYGSSSNRRTIENKLLEVKTYLPDAIIVVRED